MQKIKFKHLQDMQNMQERHQAKASRGAKLGVCPSFYYAQSVTKEKHHAELIQQHGESVIIERIIDAKSIQPKERMPHVIFINWNGLIVRWNSKTSSKIGHDLSRRAACVPCVRAVPH